MPSVKLENARILITNDDGYSAEGIKILTSIAKEFSDDVWVVAPQHEKSGASHALSSVSYTHLTLPTNREV